MKLKWKLAILLSLMSGSASAAEWVRDIEVTQVGTYQGWATHYVWFSVTPTTCKVANPAVPVMAFSETQPGGKALLASLMTALVSKRKVDLQADGCQIYEIYLK